MLCLSYTAFVIIAPLVILYAVGYRPRISSPIPRPVGVILADALPSGAVISIDGQQYGSLPRAIPNIEPGFVNVTVEKSGYEPWQKLLEVKPTQATDIRSIQLTPSSLESEVLLQDVQMFSVSPNGPITAIVNAKNELRVQDALGAPLAPLHMLPRQPMSLAWSPDSTHILVSFPQNTYQIFRIQDKRIEKLPIKNFSITHEALWSGVEQGVIYGMNASRAIISYNVLTDTATVLAKDVNIYTSFGRSLYFQTIQNELKELQLRNLEERTIWEDTEKRIKKISISQDGIMAILFADTSLALKKQNEDPIVISPFAEDAHWSPDGQLLLVHTTPMELHVYNVDNERLFAIPQDELHLVTRLSRRITRPQWFSDSLHVLYQTSDGIFFSEIDTRDHAIVRNIDSDIISQFIAIGEDSESILYTKRNGSMLHLVQTWLLTKEDR